MLKKINWRIIFKSFFWLISLAGLVVLMSFINIKKAELKCTKVEIIIPGEDNFIEREEVDEILRMSQGVLVGRSLASINIHQIEKSLKDNPYIASAKVFMDMDGVIHIAVKQRQPVLRILNAGGQDFYIDNEGLKMPMSPNFTANVLVATGQILEGFGGKIDTLFTPLAKDLYKTALFLKNDTLWDAQIEQIYVNQKSDIELVPRVGSQKIILGSADSLATKMNNLLAFYKEAIPKVGWGAYKTINLKYTNQIVCEKADSLLNKKTKGAGQTVTNVINSTADSTSNATIAPIANKVDAKKNEKVVVNEVNKPVQKNTAKVISKDPVKSSEKSTSKPDIKSTAKKENSVDKKSTDQKKIKTDTKKVGQ